MSVAKFTREEIALRNTRENATIIVDNVVYDVSKFLEVHPGSRVVLLENAGKDASERFHYFGHDSEVAHDWMQKLAIGEVVDEDKWEVHARPQVAEDPVVAPANESVLSVWGPPIAVALLVSLLYNYLFE